MRGLGEWTIGVWRKECPVVLAGSCCRYLRSGSDPVILMVRRLVVEAVCFISIASVHITPDRS